jgi:hypothetical protein
MEFLGDWPPTVTVTVTGLERVVSGKRFRGLFPWLVASCDKRASSAAQPLLGKTVPCRQDLRASFTRDR